MAVIPLFVGSIFTITPFVVHVVEVNSVAILTNKIRAFGIQEIGVDTVVTGILSTDGENLDVESPYIIVIATWTFRIVKK
ncbi:MAG: hypothetical protein QF392_02065 [Candidatus Poseidoniia archaeon]|nr:hypothetical protein [Candidatus Poseidoniia archaeon]